MAFVKPAVAKDDRAATPPRSSASSQPSCSPVTGSLPVKPVCSVVEVPCTAAFVNAVAMPGSTPAVSPAPMRLATVEIPALMNASPQLCMPAAARLA